MRRPFFVGGGRDNGIHQCANAAEREGSDLGASQTILMSGDGAEQAKTPVDPSVGLSKGAEAPWRFLCISR